MQAFLAFYLYCKCAKVYARQILHHRPLQSTNGQPNWPDISAIHDDQTKIQRLHFVLPYKVSNICHEGIRVEDPLDFLHLHDLGAEQMLERKCCGPGIFRLAVCHHREHGRRDYGQGLLQFRRRKKRSLPRPSSCPSSNLWLGRTLPTRWRGRYACSSRTISGRRLW